MKRIYNSTGIRRSSVRIMILLGGLVLAAREHAAGQSKPVNLELNYSVSGPTGAFHDFISNQSWKGWQANILYPLTKQLELGLGVAYQDFYQQYPRQLYKLTDGSDISAVVTNSVQTIPVLLQARYTFYRGKVRPYAGIGVGGNMILFDQYLGEFSNSHNHFKFAARPQVGVQIPIGQMKVAAVNISAAYNYLPYREYGLDNVSNWNVSAGLKFPLR